MSGKGSGGAANLSRPMRYALEKVVQGEAVERIGGVVRVNMTPSTVMPVPFTKATLDGLERRGLIRRTLVNDGNLGKLYQRTRWLPTEEGTRLLRIQAGGEA